LSFRSIRRLVEIRLGQLSRSYERELRAVRKLEVGEA